MESVQTDILQLSAEQQAEALELFRKQEEEKERLASAERRKRAVEEWEKNNWHPHVNIARKLFYLIFCLGAVAVLVSLIGLWACGKQPYCSNGSHPADCGGDSWKSCCPDGSEAPTRKCSVFDDWIWTVVGTISTCLGSGLIGSIIDRLGDRGVPLSTSSAASGA